MIKFYFTFILSFVSVRMVAQINDFHSSLSVEGIIASHDEVPFWLRSDQFGSVPLPGTSGSFIGAAHKDYDSAKMHVVDWGASAEVRADIGSLSHLTLIEGYGKLRISIFELKAGRGKEIMGLVDTSLSSGAFAVSGNALGVPKVQLSIPEYWSLPFARKLFSIKGNFAHGWLGEQPIQSSVNVNEGVTYFHQSSFYGRFGKPGWKLKLFGGFNHQVFWGSEKLVNGNKYNLSPFKTYEYVVLGRTYEGSKIGNHLGSVDLGLEYDFSGTKLFIYRQNFYDEGALAKLANIADGLNGLSLLNKSMGRGGLQWHKLVFELFYSKDQAGYPWSTRTASGDENYYNNYQYSDGWSYKGLGLGNPFITPAATTRTGLPNDPTDFFNNNRVVAFYSGMEGSLGKYRFRTRLSYSLNYGTFGTSQWGYSTGSIFVPPAYGIFKEVKEFSAYLEISRSISRSLQIALDGGLDSGGLFYNSSGIILKIKKSF